MDGEGLMKQTTLEEFVDLASHGTFVPVCKEIMADFIDGLELPEEAKVEMKKLTPANYIGRAVEFIDNLA